jgi:hypothetical protein
MKRFVAIGLGLCLGFACAGGGAGGGDDPGDEDPGDEDPGDEDPGDEDPGDDMPGDDNPGDDTGDPGDPIDFGDNNLIASPSPPGRLAPADAPQIIVFGWDDMAFTGDHQGDAGSTDSGMNFIAQTFGTITNPNGDKGAVSFYQNGAYLPSTEQGGPWGSETNLMLAAGRELIEKGFEVGSHTFDHLEINGTWGRIPPAWKMGSLGGWTEKVGTLMDQASWMSPVISFNDQHLISSYGLGVSKLSGFRAPRLEINDAGLRALAEYGYLYECSLEEGNQWEHVTAAVLPGTDTRGHKWTVWPHTLDHGSPGSWQSQDFGEKAYLANLPKGLWEVPVYMLYIPDNGLQEEIATRMKREITTEDTSWIGDKVREITAFDFNTFLYARMRKAEWVEVMKYNFLLRYNGNRAPLTFGAHPEQFSARYDREVLSQPNNADFADVLTYNTFQDRKDAVREFVTWVKQNYPDDVYFMSGKQLVEYMKAPFDKTGKPVAADALATPGTEKLFELQPEWVVNKDDIGSDATIAINGLGATVDFTIGRTDEAAGKYPFVDVATYFAAGTLGHVSHIDLVYEAAGPFRLRLLQEETGPLSMQVLLSGGTGERKARLRMKDFMPDNYAPAAKIAAAGFVNTAYMDKVIGLSLEAAATKDRTSFQVKIKRIVVHGLADSQSLAKARARAPSRLPATKRTKVRAGSSVFWPAHAETHVPH